MTDRRLKCCEVFDAQMLQWLAGLQVEHGYKIERVGHDPVSACTVFTVSHPTFDVVREGHRLPELKRCD